jgi:hypothetical protein
MTQEDRDFLELHKINFEAIELGYTRNIQFNDLTTYTEIYKRYLDPKFFLNAWCGACVFDMLKRLNNYYKNLKPIEQPNVQTKNPRGRKSK